MIGMTRPKAKATITIDADLLDAVKAAVANGGSPSVSAYIEHAVAGQLASESDFDDMVDEMLGDSGGPPSADERAAARALLTEPAA